jgi:hypothetical protein
VRKNDRERVCVLGFTSTGEINRSGRRPLRRPAARRRTRPTRGNEDLATAGGALRLESWEEEELLVADLLLGGGKGREVGILGIWNLGGVGGRKAFCPSCRKGKRALRATVGFPLDFF